MSHTLAQQTDPIQSETVRTDTARSDAELADLLRARARCDDPAVRDRFDAEIARRTMPFAERLARRYVSRGVELDELVAVAELALVKAMSRFSYDAGSSFWSFAHATINGELKRHFRDHAWAVRPTRAIQELRPRIRDAVERRDAVGADCSDALLAEELGVPRSEVRQARGAGQLFTAASLDSPGGRIRPLSETLADEADDFARVDDHDLLTRCCCDLGDDEWRLIDLRFVQELSQAAIGERLGVSQMQVSRRLAMLIDKLRERAGVSAPA